MLVENLEGVLEFMVEMLVLLFGGMAIVAGHEEALSVGQLIAFTMYWDILRDGVDGIQNVFSDLMQASGAAQRVFDLLDISPDIPLDDGVEFRRDNFRGEVAFDAVHFAYQSRPDKKVLGGLDLEVPASGTCALVGRSGAGKSTLMHLLLRFYDPAQGQIKIDGVPLTALNLKSLHDLIGFVSQDTKLSYGSIRDNLTYGLPWGAPEEGELEAAATAANCAEFIDEMEDGYDSKIGEGGVRLSGGQRQRLAIARAFLRRPRLLVLDEATSHLDTENEQLVQGAVDRLIQGARGEGGAGGCTVILIAHRLSTVRNADIIAVLHEGRVVEKGSHEELVRVNGGMYAQLVSKQAERAANVLPEEGGAATRGADVDKLFDKVLGREERIDRGSESGSSSGSGTGSSSSGSGSSSSSSSESSSDKKKRRQRPQPVGQGRSQQRKPPLATSEPRDTTGARAEAAGGEVEGQREGESGGESSSGSEGAQLDGKSRASARRAGLKCRVKARGGVKPKAKSKTKTKAEAKAETSTTSA